MYQIHSFLNINIFNLSKEISNKYNKINQKLKINFNKIISKIWIIYKLIH